MSSIPLTALRPLAFPSHRWAALVCLRTGRVLALVPASPEVEAKGGTAKPSGQLTPRASVRRYATAEAVS